MFLSILIIWFLYKKNTKLLLKILPKGIAQKIKQNNSVIADKYENVGVVFIDMVGFSDYSKNKNPEQIIKLLNKVFGEIDTIAEKHGVEKIKTIGDCYFAASGVPESSENSMNQILDFTLEVIQFFADFKTDDGWNVQFTAGLDFGEVVAGVIGNNKFLYDVWGEVVNNASALVQTSETQRIHLKKNLANRLKNNYIFEN